MRISVQDLAGGMAQAEEGEAKGQIGRDAEGVGQHEGMRTRTRRHRL